MTELATTNNDFRAQFLQRFVGLTEVESHELIDILTQDTPKEWIQKRVIGGGGEANYVAGFRFIQRFNEAFGFLWSYEVPKTWNENNNIVAQGRWSLQIPGRTITRKLPDGTEETIRFDGFSVVKEQFGSAEVKLYAQDIYAKDKNGNARKDASGRPIIRYKKGDMMDLGNDYKAAATDAMKKCGTTLGMFLDVYGQHEQSEISGPTAAQLQAFYVRAEKAGYDRDKADAWAQEQIGKPLKEASQQNVLSLIADLIDLAKKQ